MAEPLSVIRLAGFLVHEDMPHASIAARRFDK